MILVVNILTFHYYLLGMVTDYMIPRISRDRFYLRLPAVLFSVYIMSTLKLLLSVSTVRPRSVVIHYIDSSGIYRDNVV